MSVMTFSRKAAVLLLAVLILLAISGVGVRAENERNVIYDGEAKKIVSLPDDDLFFNLQRAGARRGSGAENLAQQ